MEKPLKKQLQKGRQDAKGAMREQRPCPEGFPVPAQHQGTPGGHCIPVPISQGGLWKLNFSPSLTEAENTFGGKAPVQKQCETQAVEHFLWWESSALAACQNQPGQMGKVLKSGLIFPVGLKTHLQTCLGLVPCVVWMAV